MTYYKDPSNKVHWLDPDQDLHMLPSGSVAITADEAEVLRQPQLTLQQQIEIIKAEIDEIERADLMNRRAREAFILQAEALAASQYNMTPLQLYAVNPGYKGAKDVDDLCKAKRLQIKALEDQL
jgi:hypothetical protein